MNFIARNGQNTHFNRAIVTLLMITGLSLVSTFGYVSIFATESYTGTGDLLHQRRAANPFQGYYNGTLVITAPVNIGVVDVTIQLTSTQGTSTGFVLDSTTSHFSQNPAISASITGSNDNSTPTFSIQSTSFAEVIAGQAITRSFTINGEVLGNGSILTGSYTESIIGYTKEPLQIAGSVLLSRSEVGVAQVPSTPATPGPTPTPTPTPNVPGTSGENNIFLPFVNGEPGNISAAGSSEQATSQAEQTQALEQEIHLPIINSR